MAGDEGEASLEVTSRMNDAAWARGLAKAAQGAYRRAGDTAKADEVARWMKSTLAG